MAGSYGNSTFIFWETIKLFSTMAEPVYILTSNVQGLQSPHACQQFCFCFLIGDIKTFLYRAWDDIRAREKLMLLKWDNCWKEGNFWEGERDVPIRPTNGRCSRVRSLSGCWAAKKERRERCLTSRSHPDGLVLSGEGLAHTAAVNGCQGRQSRWSRFKGVSSHPQGVVLWASEVTSETPAGSAIEWR